MENTNMNKFKIIKIALMIISIVIVLFTLTGYVLTSDKGGTVSLALFESFYVYIVAMGIAFYMAIANKNANIMIVISILTYGWTYYLVQQMINYLTDVNIIITPYFYVYLSSVIFLIISLFINEKKQVNDNIPENLQNINKDNFIFANFVLGAKEIPSNAETLLVNNTTDGSLDLIYAVDNGNKTIKLPIKDVKNISYKPSMRMQNVSKNTESNETKSMLLSAVAFGGMPILQLAGNGAFNSLFDGLSNNYDKVNFNAYYEITIEVLINGQEHKFILDTVSNPDIFIKLVNNK